MEGGVPVLVKAPDNWINLARAVIPLAVPRIIGRDMWDDAFSSILRCWLYLGQSRRICVLVSSVSSSQGQDVGSGDVGRNVCLNSPV